MSNSDEILEFLESKSLAELKEIQKALDNWNEPNEDLLGEDLNHRFVNIDPASRKFTLKKGSYIFRTRTFSEARINNKLRFL